MGMCYKCMMLRNEEKISSWKEAAQVDTMDSLDILEIQKISSKNMAGGGGYQ